jgi:hypothetical protein
MTLDFPPPTDYPIGNNANIANLKNTIRDQVLLDVSRIRHQHNIYKLIKRIKKGED